MLFALPPIKMLRVNPQLATKLNYDKNVFHGYINQNLSRLNNSQETVVTIVFNVVAQGKGAVFS
jgi:hypothetical protein